MGKKGEAVMKNSVTEKPQRGMELISGPECHGGRRGVRFSVKSAKHKRGRGFVSSEGEGGGRRKGVKKQHGGSGVGSQ